MRLHCFINPNRLTPCATQNEEMGTARSKLFRRLGFEIYTLIFEHCSPYDLVVLRDSCQTFKKFLERTPTLWRMARKNRLNTPSPPPNMTEWAWAALVFTGIMSMVPDLSRAWQKKYEAEWRRARKSNLSFIHEWIEATHANRSLGKKELRRMAEEFMRSPICNSLIRAYVRDLQAINRTSWEASLPAIYRELAQISACDISTVPPGFQFFETDRVICRVCHAKPSDVRQHALALKTIKEQREWFTENTVVVQYLVDHFKSRYGSSVS
ncbi:hypothetical protein HDZ31DRAFT_67199 [Schizophyllum fasciatum]